MIAFAITYHVRGDKSKHETLIDAKNIQSAKRKIARKHKSKNGQPYKDGRVIVVDRCLVVGYF